MTITQPTASSPGRWMRRSVLLALACWLLSVVLLWGQIETHVLHPDPAHLVGTPVRAPSDIGRMFGERADAGNRKQRFQLVEILVAIDVDEVDDVVHVA